LERNKSSYVEYLVGLDDTDSAKGMCTTYLAYTIISNAKNFSVKPYPRLVRLNPNIPFKTRGNAAVCLEIETENESTAFEELCSYAEKFSDVPNGANTGLVFLRKDSNELFFRQIYFEALRGIVNPRKVEKVLRNMDAKYFTLGNGMGLIGASAAIGFDFEDYTYELIAYRAKENWGKPRAVDAESVISMDKDTFPHTFNNFDYEKRRVMISPHGPDPVLLGIRGDNPSMLLRAFSLLKIAEPVEGYVVYVTNQHTDAHILYKIEMKSFSSGWFEGTIRKINKIHGGHLIIEFEESEIPAAVYSPTGDLVRIAEKLMPGDRVRVYGGMRRPSKNHSMVLNAERIDVLFILDKIYTNPVCDKCGKKMKSEGLGKGFGCRTCGLKKKEKTPVTIERGIVPGIYLSSTRAHRHLTKPFARYLNGTKPKQVTIEKWFCNFLQHH
jgi:tRNA(Ile2)-agmatinylcytidine synthase